MRQSKHHGEGVGSGGDGVEHLVGLEWGESVEVEGVDGYVGGGDEVGVVDLVDLDYELAA